MLMLLVGMAMTVRQGHARPQLGPEGISIVSGTVASASPDRLVLITDPDPSLSLPEGEEMVVALTPETQLTWGAQRLAATELRSGDTVTVRYIEASGRKVAHTIWALSARLRELAPMPTLETTAEDAYQLANRLTTTSQFRKALPYLDQAILLRPGFLAAYARRGYTYAALATLEVQQDFKQAYRQRALADYTTAIREGLKNGLHASEWYNNRGVLYMQLQENQRALEDFTEALHIDATYVLALTNRATVRRYLGDWDGAIADLTQVLALEPHVGKWHCQRGMTWLQQENDRQAQQDFQRCFDLEPSLRESYTKTIEKVLDKRQGI
jgi:tetratricopeptide (TPR) repeat protein